jgi:LCP family protein required for cell wall assembly
MGKHTMGSKPTGSGGEGKRRTGDAGKRRVPAERRRSPGERATSAGVRGGAESFQLEDAASRRRGSLEAAPARLRMERDRRRARTKRIAAIAVAVIAVVIVLLGGGVFAYAQHIQRTMQSTIVKQEKLNPALKPAEPLKPFTILLLGADYRKGETAYRTDTIILAKIDPQAKKVWMLSIPRDTKVLIPKHGTQKINSAHALGGPELTIETVELFTGVPINHYMEVNFQGFQGAVTALGGVWVNVPHAINDKKAASQSVHQRASKIPAGYQLLGGEQALTFVRTRAFADADISRMKDQQIFFKAVADQMTKTDVTKMIRVINAMAPYIQTDMSLMQIIKTAVAIKDTGSKNMYTATVGGDWKSPYIITDDVLKKKLIGDMKAGRSFEPTRAAVATNTAATSKKAAKPAAALAPSAVKVTVRNGAGISGIAKQAALILKAKGFAVGETGNANQSVYKKTLVVYKSDRAAAELLAASLMPGTTVVESRGMYSFPTEVLLVVGKDWDAGKIPVAQVSTN